MSIEFKLTAATIFVLASPFAAGLLTGVADVLFGGANQGVGRRALQKFYDLLDLWKDTTTAAEAVPLVRMKWALVLMAASGVLLVIGDKASLCAIAFSGGILLMQKPGDTRAESQLLLGIPILFSAAAGMILLSGTDEMETAIASPQTLFGYLPAVWIGILVMTAIIAAGLREERAFGESAAAHGYRMAALWYSLCVWTGLLYVFLWKAVSENSWTAGFLCAVLYLAVDFVSRILPRIPCFKSSIVRRNAALLLLGAIAFNLVVISFSMR